MRDPGRRTEIVGLAGMIAPSTLDAVVSAATRAQPAWERLGPDYRADILDRIADLLDNVEIGLVETLTRENGSILGVSRNELLAAARIFRYTAEHTRAALSSPEFHSSGGVELHLQRKPFGVVGCIVPWNAPVILAAQKLAPALAAGNAVILKPSPFSPLVVTALIERMASLLPAGLVSVIHGDADVGNALVMHPGVRMVSFTGGGSTAKAIMRSAAETLVHLHFELGGNDPAIVLADADIPGVACSIVEHAFRRAGQVCYAIKRVYVPRDSLSEFVDAAVSRIEEISVGHGLDSRSTMGPVNNRAQFERIRSLHRKLSAAEVPVVTAGRKVDPESWDEGFYLLPALVVDAPPLSAVVLEEQFGPILPIVGYDDLDEAVALANNTEFGLASSVWSSDVSRASEVAGRIEAGITFVNGHALTPVAQQYAPFGGVKQSGMGWENSRAGLGEYLEYHSVHVVQPAQ
ncbi:aldehyde dehydrogenase family protein [Subtercola sp. YIM 133946]|uniref:aldehyde dehydrogenase family protein n=1 Tax=Subtercola sp. YIM 133946 TaxID=3118909 RepID=UPI002F94D9D5